MAGHWNIDYFVYDNGTMCDQKAQSLKYCYRRASMSNILNEYSYLHVLCNFNTDHFSYNLRLLFTNRHTRFHIFNKMFVFSFFFFYARIYMDFQSVHNLETIVFIQPAIYAFVLIIVRRIFLSISDHRWQVRANLYNSFKLNT